MSLPFSVEVSSSVFPSRQLPPASCGEQAPCQQPDERIRSGCHHCTTCLNTEQNDLRHAVRRKASTIAIHQQRLTDPQRDRAASAPWQVLPACPERETRAKSLCRSCVPIWRGHGNLRSGRLVHFSERVQRTRRPTTNRSGPALRCACDQSRSCEQLLVAGTGVAVHHSPSAPKHKRKIGQV